MRFLFRDPKTTFGGVIAFGAVAGLLAHQLDLTASVALLGIAAAWIGVTGKDGSA
jgi:hypothetical protein